MDEVYDHRQVKHSERYVSEEEAHCNTAESEWSVFKPWLRTFRGLAKRHLYLYLSEHSFQRSHRHLSWQERTEVVLGLMKFFWLGQATNLEGSVIISKSGCWDDVPYFS